MNRQVFPDTYSTPVKLQVVRPNTNNRYKHFNQTHYTIGDEEQFENSLLKSEVKKCLFEEMPEFIDLKIWENYRITLNDSRNTFQYIFRKFKKGIFIQIRNNKIANFAPFSNVFFTNEWHDRIKIPNELTKNLNILPVTHWYTNNGIFRYENPCNETDTGICQMKNMFETLCNQYPNEIPDIDFFVNRRDFPILKTDFTEPYNNIYDSHDFPLVSHKYEKYCPVLSSCTVDGFADIPIPTMDDWTRVLAKENRYFASTKRTIATSDIFTTPWDKKKPRVVFRGSNTGIGSTIETNIRLKLCHEFQSHPYFNVGISSWSDRYRKEMGNENVLYPNKYENLTSSPLSLEEQSTYKYIVHVEGHVQAFRLSIEMAMQSVILLVDSKYKLWYQDKMIPWFHYVPVSSDLSDLLERVQWCMDNDNEAKNIAKNARIFYEKYLCKENCLSYLKNLVRKIAGNCIQVPYNNHVIQQRNIQTNYIRKYFETYREHNIIICPKSSNSFLEILKLCKSGKYNTKNILFQSNNTTISLYDKKYVHKTSKHNHKFDHEVFVGIFCVNRMLLQIPNFIYTYPLYRGRGIYLEYVEGITLFDYIKSQDFDLEKWKFIVLQLLLALSVSQRMCYFVHNDMCPWNIMLVKLKQPKYYDYIIDVDKVYRVKTDIIPVIIDYDKAHVVHEMQKFDSGCKNSFRTYQDSLCLMVSCMYNILRYQKLSFSDEKQIINIFTRCLVDKKYCSEENTENIKSIKSFLNEAHKYAHITFSDKGELEHKTPMDMFENIMVSYRQTDTNNISRASFIEYRNISTKSQNHIPKNIHLFLEIYLNELYGNRSFERKPEVMLDIGTIDLPIMEEIKDQDKLILYPSNYNNYLNIFYELIHSPKLFKEEKNRLISSLENLLKNRENVYKYCRYLINFKLSRNIF